MRTLKTKFPRKDDGTHEIKIECRLSEARYLRDSLDIDLLSSEKNDVPIIARVFEDPLTAFEIAHIFAVDFTGTLTEFEELFDTDQYRDLAKEVGEEILSFIQNLDPRKSSLLRKSIERYISLADRQLQKTVEMFDRKDVTEALEAHLDRDIEELTSTLLETLGKKSTSGSESLDSVPVKD